MDRQAFRFQHGAQVSAGGPLAIGARDMEHGRQVSFRIAEAVEDCVNHLKPDAPLRQRQGRKPIKLRLHLGIAR